jgi:hypothetical protein
MAASLAQMFVCLVPGWTAMCKWSAAAEPKRLEAKRLDAWGEGTETCRVSGHQLSHSMQRASCRGS